MPFAIAVACASVFTGFVFDPSSVSWPIELDAKMPHEPSTAPAVGSQFVIVELLEPPAPPPPVALAPAAPVDDGDPEPPFPVAVLAVLESQPEMSRETMPPTGQARRAITRAVRRTGVRARACPLVLAT
ncbi:MAG TPA: hypothetical protein VGM56_25205 [Byssovorax sp.]|jgi:hypothetical protein